MSLEHQARLYVEALEHTLLEQDYKKFVQYLQNIYNLPRDSASDTNVKLELQNMCSILMTYPQRIDFMEGLLHFLEVDKYISFTKQIILECEAAEGLLKMKSSKL
jgi:hypothetical protein